MGVAADQFVDYGLADLLDGEAAFLGRDLGVEDDLQQHVAQFAAQLVVVAGVDGLQRLVGLFEQIGFEAGVGLFAVPGTAVGRPQPGHHLH